jgi:hypothetical protein
MPLTGFRIHVLLSAFWLPIPYSFLAFHDLEQP